MKAQRESVAEPTWTTTSPSGRTERQLKAMAMELGLTEAIRRGLPERPDRYGRMRAPSMQNIRRLVNAHADDTLLFNLYRAQALAWHSQFDRAVADNLQVLWSDDLGLEIVPRVAARVVATA
jgi:hypothetical protein